MLLQELLESPHLALELAGLMELLPSNLDKVRQQRAPAPAGGRRGHAHVAMHTTQHAGALQPLAMPHPVLCSCTPTPPRPPAPMHITPCARCAATCLCAQGAGPRTPRSCWAAWCRRSSFCETCCAACLLLQTAWRGWTASCSRLVRVCPASARSAHSLRQLACAVSCASVSNLPPPRHPPSHHPLCTGHPKQPREPGAARAAV